jgi:hypothetical protein
MKILPTLLAGRCEHHATDEIEAQTDRDRVKAMGVAFISLCPVIDINGDLLGVIFTQWDAMADVPVGKALTQVEEKAAKIGLQLAVTLEVQVGEP